MYSHSVKVGLLYLPAVMYGILQCLNISVMVLMHGFFVPPPKHPFLHLHGTVFSLLSIKMYI